MNQQELGPIIAALEELNLKLVPQEEMNQQELAPAIAPAIAVLEELNSEFEEASRKAIGEEGLDLDSKIAMIYKATQEAIEKRSIPGTFFMETVYKNGRIGFRLNSILPVKDLK